MKTEQGGQEQKRQRRKYVSQPYFDEEKTESDDINQFKVVSHNPLSDLENLCENVKSNVDLSSFRHIYFDKLGKEEKHQVEEELYAMMSNFKNTPLEFSNSVPKNTYGIVEKK